MKGSLFAGILAVARLLGAMLILGCFVKEGMFNDINIFTVSFIRLLQQGD